MTVDDLSKTERTLNGIEPGPRWPNGCTHQGYLCTFRSNEARGKDVVYDLYVFENGHRQEFCLRYGPEGREYLSPGGVENIYASAGHGDPHRRARDILEALGEVRWVPTPRP